MSELNWKKILLDRSSNEYDPELYRLLMEEKKVQNLAREELIEYYYRSLLFDIVPVYNGYSYVYNEEDDLLTIVNINNDMTKVVLCIPYAFDVLDISRISLCQKYLQLIDLGNIQTLIYSCVLSDLPYLKYLVANNIANFNIYKDSFNKNSLIRVYLNSAIFMEHYFFKNSRMLKYIEMKSVHLISEFLFEGCPNLECIVLSKRAGYISPVAFNNYNNINIIYYGSAEDWAKLDINYYCSAKLNIQVMTVEKEG